VIQLALALVIASGPKTDILRSNVDPTVSPAVDFFEYANGGWFKKHPIPGNETNWGIGNLVRDELYARLRKVNELAVKAHAAPGSDTQKVGDFWRTALDEQKAERIGLTPLQPELDRINNVSTVQ
jgi:putative endopeptidase